jgi:hypothetical protein
VKAPAELWTVARSLGDILGEVVFVGGMIRELLITDPAAGAARPTQDVDCIVNAVSWADYAQLSGRLRSRGFSECTDEGAPICRWVVQSVRVDLMPIDPIVLGFSNVWYPSTVEHAILVQSPDGSIRIADAVHFCATKIEAFLGRGEGDFLHHDMEDFMAVVDARPELLSEIQHGPNDLRDFMAEQVGEWLGDHKFLEALSWHLEGGNASQARRPLLLSKLKTIASLHQAETNVAPSASTLQPPLIAAAQPFVQTARAGLHGQSPLSLGPPSAHVFLRSTNLRAAAYDPTTQVLTIEFRSGSAYTYKPVPQNVYAGLLAAGSHGRYFHRWIRGRYPYRLVR